jgi:hypothetical protein
LQQGKKKALSCSSNRLASSRPTIRSASPILTCTDSIDDQGHGVVSNAGTVRAPSLTSIAHLILLWAYIVNRKPDVHSGYFEPGFVSRLIYRFACGAAIARKPTAISKSSATCARNTR